MCSDMHVNARWYRDNSPLQDSFESFVWAFFVLIRSRTLTMNSDKTNRKEESMTHSIEGSIQWKLCLNGSSRQACLEVSSSLSRSFTDSKEIIDQVRQQIDAIRGSCQAQQRLRMERYKNADQIGTLPCNATCGQLWRQLDGGYNWSNSIIYKKSLAGGSS